MFSTKNSGLIHSPRAVLTVLEVLSQALWGSKEHKVLGLCKRAYSCVRGHTKVSVGGTEAKAVGLSWVCGAFHVSWHTDPKTTFINFSLIFFQKLDLFPSHVFTPTNLRLREPVSRVAVQMAVKSVNDHPSLRAQLHPPVCDPRDCSPPGSSVHGVFPARIQDLVAIAFSNPSLINNSVFTASVVSNVNIYPRTHHHHCD